MNSLQAMLPTSDTWNRFQDKILDSIPDTIFGQEIRKPIATTHQNSSWVSRITSHPVGRRLLTLSLIFTSSISLRYLFLKFQNKKAKLVPRMIGVPIFGSLFTAYIYGKKFLSNILPSYGPIVTFNAGSLPITVINDSKVLKCIFNSEEARIRPKEYETVFIVPDVCLSFPQVNDNHLWKLRRQFMMSSVISIANRKFIERQVGKVLKQCIYPKIDNCLATNAQNINVSINGGAKWQAKDDLRHAVFNVVYGAIFGETAQLSKDSEEFKTIDENVKIVFENADVIIIDAVFPMLKTIGLSNWLTKGMLDKVNNGWKNIYGVMQVRIDNAIKEYNEKISNGCDRSDFTYFDELYEKVLKYRSNKGKDKMISDDMLKADLFVMLSASMDTTGNSLHIALFLAAKYFDIQEEIYNELLNNATIVNTSARNSGKSKKNPKLMFDLTKLTNCKKFRAFVNECLRIACVAVVGEVHSLTHDCILSFQSLAFVVVLLFVFDLF